MGAYVNFSNRITISNNTSQNGQLFFTGYDDIDDKFIRQVCIDEKIKYIQIADILPEKAYDNINKIFEKRQDMYFRIFGLYSDKVSRFDFSVLRRLTNVRKYIFDFSIRDASEKIDFDFLSDLPELKALRLSIFDLHDYSFINDLSDNLEELLIHADTMGKAVNFDCKWLLKFENLRSLYLGGKAKKNLKQISNIKSLRELYLRGIKVEDFSFLFDTELESLHLLYSSSNELSQLSQLKTLKNIELWRIMNLKNIDFLSELENLETIALQDLRHIIELPDLSRLKNLREIDVLNVPLDYSKIDKEIVDKIK